MACSRKHRQNLHFGITLVRAEVNARKCERASVQGDSVLRSQGPALSSPGLQSQTRSEAHEDDGPSSVVCSAIVMELAQDQQRRVVMEAELTPKDRNQEAGDLSNLLTSNFDAGKEVQVKLEDQKWLVLREPLQSGQQFQEKELEEEEIAQVEVQGKVAGVSEGAQGQGGGRGTQELRRRGRSTEEEVERRGTATIFVHRKWTSFLADTSSAGSL